MSLIVGLGLGLWVIAAMAEETGDLYSAETRVADEGSETRNAALSELLATVLVRVSGNTGIAGQPAARTGVVVVRERLGGVLRHHHRAV